MRAHFLSKTRKPGQKVIERYCRKIDEILLIKLLDKKQFSEIDNNFFWAVEPQSFDSIIITYIIIIFQIMKCNNFISISNGRNVRSLLPQFFKHSFFVAMNLDVVYSILELKICSSYFKISCLK